MASGSASKDLTPPASPAHSFYDLSDADEDEYNTITHSETGRQVKLLFSKSKVYVHPSQSSKDNIAGFVAIVQQKPAPGSSTTSSSLLLAWLPEATLGDAYDTYVKVDLSDGDSPPRQSYLVPPPPATYAAGSSSSYAFAVPVSQIYSLLIRPPNLGWWWGSVVINTRHGDSFPALFFHDSECASTLAQSKRRAKKNFDPFGENGGLFWGGDEVLRWLRRFVRVERSEVEPNVYLVEPSAEDLTSFVSKPIIDGTQRSGNNEAEMDPLTKVFKTARWNFLEGFSRVTQFTRRRAEEIVDNPKVPPQVRRLLKNPEVAQLQDEFDSARLYLARWAMGIAEQSEREQRRMMWSSRDIMELEDSAVGEFEILDMEAGSLKLDSEKRKPVNLKEWAKWFDAEGQLCVSVEEVKERVFHGGVEPGAARKEIWPFLLSVYPWDSTREERRAIMNSKRDEYIRLKGRWWDDMEVRNNDEDWRDQKNRIEKDVHRTDRNIPIFMGEDIPHPDPSSPFSDAGTNVHLEQMKDMLLTYHILNPSLGYVQGMSDLLAPLYAVFQDDALAFWCFVSFMEIMERNFLRDQSGMREQLVTLDHLVAFMDPELYKHLEKAESTNFFFFFRMLLVWFKREFGWEDTLRLWETMWTGYRSSQWQVFVALAILEKHKGVIMEHLEHFDEVLKYINELSGTIDLPSTRLRAESLFRKFQRAVEAADRANANKGLGTPGELRRRKTSGATTRKPGVDGSGGSDNTGFGGGGSGGFGGGSSKDKEEEEEGKGPIISEELRGLLRREWRKVDHNDVPAAVGKGKAGVPQSA